MIKSVKEIIQKVEIELVLDDKELNIITKHSGMIFQYDAGNITYKVNVRRKNNAD